MVRLAIVCAVLVLCGFLTFTWCTVPAVEDPQAGEFAALRPQEKSAKPAPFDGKRAMGYLKEICALGPRMSGTPSFKKQVDLIQKHFEKFGAKVTRQEFPAQQVTRKKPVDMVNLVVSWHPERMRRVILCSHYDTRPIADQEEDERKWHDPFISANDGGSGVALLMELAHHMKDLKTEVGVDFVFFDGEEYIFDKKKDEYFFGSKHFADVYRKGKEAKGSSRYVGALLFDMVGGKDAKFPADLTSFRQAKPLVQKVWAIAQELKSPVFQNKVRDQEILDDHLALLEVGIPAIDIIDFDYPHWHRLSDTPANCSGETLEQVSRVVTVWLQRVK
jgi:hypothetical protein